MSQEFSRTDRVAAQLQRELASLIPLEVRDPRLGMVTIQQVRVSRDLAHAKIFFTILGGKLSEKQAEGLLNGRVAGYLRHLIGGRLRLRNIPQFHFAHDDTEKRGARLDSLIDEAMKNDPDLSR